MSGRDPANLDIPATPDVAGTGSPISADAPASAEVPSSSASENSGQSQLDQKAKPEQPEERDPMYLEILHAYGSRFVEILIGGVLINCFGLLMPLYSRLIYDKVIGNHITDTLWALTLGLLLFGEIPTALGLGGVSIIAGAGLFLIWRERRALRGEMG